MSSSALATSLATLFGELIDGPPGRTCFVLNPGDVGLLRSLDKLDAAAASRAHEGGATIAAHVDHLRYGLRLLNRWSGGENPWDDADWGAQLADRGRLGRRVGAAARRARRRGAALARGAAHAARHGPDRAQRRDRERGPPRLPPRRHPADRPGHAGAEGMTGRTPGRAPA